MFTINKVGGHNNLKQADIICLAKDKDTIKIDSIPNGTSLYIMDYKESNTSPLYMFDEENKRWIEQ